MSMISVNENGMMPIAHSGKWSTILSLLNQYSFGTNGTEDR
jgi:hypothetical protein